MSEEKYYGDNAWRERIPQPPRSETLFDPEEDDWQRRSLKPARRHTPTRTRTPMQLSETPDPRPRTAATKPAPAARPAARPASAATAAAKKPAPVKKASGSTASAAKRPATKAAVPAKRKAVRAKKTKYEMSRGLSIALTALLSAAIIAVAALQLRHISDHQRFEEMRSVVERKSFYAGTQVDGIDLSGMSLRKAQEYWANSIEPAYAERTVVIEGTDGRSITAADLGYTSNYLDVLATAWDAGRSGSLAERYLDITERTVAPESYSVTRKLYDNSLIDRYVQAAASAMNRAPTEPELVAFDWSEHRFTFTEGTSGQRLDEEQMAADIRAALENGGGSVTMVLNEVPPEGNVQELEAAYGMITSARTNASTSSNDRLTNLRVALSAIDGVTVKPGQTFSFNETLGQRTTDKGYKTAAAYNSGQVVEDVGGGICQVSTTLFNAVVKANLEIAERHNHSIPVSYVDKGKDATVNWGRQDFKFVNSSDENIYIQAYLTSDKRVVVAIYGKKLPDGIYITVEGVTTGTEEYKTVYETTTALAPGQENVKQKGRTGYTAEAYKIVWDKNGKQLSRTLLCKSHYYARDKIIEVGKQ